MTEAARLKAVLAALPAAVAPRVQAALATVAAQAVAEARRRLPPGPLADSIAIGRAPDTGVATVTASAPATFVEYGTVHRAARPFLRPAVTTVSGAAQAHLGGVFAAAVAAHLDDRS